MSANGILTILAASFVLSSKAVDLVGTASDLRKGKGRYARGSEKTRKRARQRRQSGKGNR